MPYQRDANGRLVWVPSERSAGSGRTPAASRAAQEIEDAAPNPLREFLTAPPPPEPAPAPRSLGFRDLLPTIVRAASGLAPGGRIGALAGGGGELAAELLEGRAGFDKGTAARVGIQSAIGAVPFGPAKGVARVALRGAAHGGVGAGATDITEQLTDETGLTDLITGQEAKPFDPVRALKATAMGTVLGGTAGAGFGALQRLLGRRGPNAPSEPIGIKDRGPDTFEPSHPEYRGAIPEEQPIGVRDRGPDTFQPSVPEYRGAIPENQPIAVRPRDPSPFELREEASGTMFDPAAAVQAPPKPRLAAGEVAGMLRGREKFAGTVGPQGVEGLTGTGTLDELDRMGVEYNRAQSALKKLLGMPDADPQEVGRMQQGARELGSRLRRYAKEAQEDATVRPISGGDHVRVPDEILPPEPTGLSRVQDPLHMITGVDDLPHAQVRPQGSDVSKLAEMLGVNLQNVPTSKRGARVGTDVSAPTPQAEVTPQYASKIANDVLGQRKVPKAPPVTDEQASSLRRLFSEQGGGATIRPETSEDYFTAQGGRRLPAEFGGMLDDESGQISPELGVQMLSTILGAGAGSFATDDPLTGAAIGGAAGFAGPAVYRNPKLLEHARFASLLSSPVTMAKNVVGNAGAVTAEATERALMGEPETAGRILREFFSPKTVQEGVEGFRNPVRLGHESKLDTDIPTEGLISVPSRVLGATDVASKGALGRAGLSPEDASRITFTSEPETEFFRGLLALQRRSRMAKVLSPFVRTASNIVEQGVKRTPAGLLALRNASPEQRRRILAQVGLGTAAGITGSEYFDENPMLAALLGPYALPYALGGVAGSALDEGADFNTAVNRASHAFGQQLPIPDAYNLRPDRLLSSFVPNAARDVAEVLDPVERDESGLFGPAVSKIPVLRETLPAERKRRPAPPRRKKRE